MGPTFGHLGLNFRELIQRAAPLCPDAGQPKTKTSEWAEKKLNFVHSAKQAEVFDGEAGYLIF